MRRRRRRTATSQVELNITAFMNLMVILVPFLLITAVFSRMSILDLNVPTPQAAQNEVKKDFQLEITIRDDAVAVGDRHGGLIRRITRVDGDYDYAALSRLLQEIKRRYPDKRDVVLLLEPDIPYDSLIHIMDATRAVPVMRAGERVQAELFPDISIGDATPQAGAARGG